MARSLGVVAYALAEVLASIGQRRLSVRGGDLRARQVGDKRIELATGHLANVIPSIKMRDNDGIAEGSVSGCDDGIGFGLGDLDRLVVSHNIRIARHPASGSPVDRSERIARLMGSTH